MRTTVRPVLFFCLLFCSFSLFALPKGMRHIDDNDTVPIRGNIHALARPEFDAGPTDVRLPYERMILVLQPRAGARQELDSLLA